MKISGTAWSPFSKNCRFGTRPRTSSSETTRFSSSVAWSNALIASGVSCSVVSRRVAVTTTSPSVDCVWACADITVGRHSIAPPSTENEVLMFPPKLAFLLRSTGALRPKTDSG